jgi:steroid delta-isomerase-like uncharacterized protein
MRRHPPHTSASPLPAHTRRDMWLRDRLCCQGRAAGRACRGPPKPSFAQQTVGHAYRYAAPTHDTSRTGAPVQRTEMVEAIHRSLDLINSHDAAGTASLFAPEVVLEDVGTGLRLEGRDAYIASSEEIESAFSDLHREILSITTEGSRAVVEYVWEGTHDGPLVLPTATIPSSGRHVVIRFAGVIEFDENGKVISVRRYTNPLGLLTQIGVLDVAALTS